MVDSGAAPASMSGRYGDVPAASDRAQHDSLSGGEPAEGVLVRADAGAGRPTRPTAHPARDDAGDRRVDMDLAGRCRADRRR